MNAEKIAKKQVNREIKSRRNTLKETREEIRESLLDALQDNGIFGKVFEDLVEDYLKLWDIKNTLINDVKRRGVKTKWQNSETSFGYKKNDSVSEAVKVSAQMLKILLTLGLKPGSKAGDGDGEFEEM